MQKLYRRLKNKRRNSLSFSYVMNDAYEVPIGTQQISVESRNAAFWFTADPFQSTVLNNDLPPSYDTLLEQTLTEVTSYNPVADPEENPGTEVNCTEAIPTAPPFEDLDLETPNESTQEQEVQGTNLPEPDPVCRSLEDFQKILDFFENQSAISSEAVKPNHKRSQLTRKLSKSCTELDPSFRLVKEEAKLQGDSVEQTNLLNQSETKEKEDPKNDTSQLLLQLFQYYKPIFEPNVQTEVQVYTVDELQYDVKVNSPGIDFYSESEQKQTKLSPKKLELGGINPQLIPRSVSLANKEKGNGWEDSKVSDILNFIKAAAAGDTFGSVKTRNDAYMHWPTENLNEILGTSAKNDISELSQQRPRKAYLDTNFSSSSAFSFQESEAGSSITTIRNLNRHPRTKTTNSGVSTLKIHVDNRLHNMPLRRQTVADSNNNELTEVILSSSSSTDSIQTRTRSVSFREPPQQRRQFDSNSNSQYSFRYRRPETPGPSGHNKVFSQRPNPFRDSSFSKTTLEINDDDGRTNFIDSSSHQSGVSGTGGISQKTMLIEDATHATTLLFRDLKMLWRSVMDKNSIPGIPIPGNECHRLLELIQLCSFIVKEMKNDWPFMDSPYSNTIK